MAYAPADIVKRNGVFIVQHPPVITAFLKCTGKEPIKKRAATIMAVVANELLKHDASLQPGRSITIRINVEEPPNRDAP